MVWHFHFSIVTPRGDQYLTVMLSEKPWRIEALMMLALTLSVTMLLGGLAVGILKDDGRATASTQGSLMPLIIGTLSFHGAIFVGVHFFLRQHGMSWATAFGFNSPKQMTVILLAIGATIVVLPVAWFLIRMSAGVMLLFHVEPVAQKAVTTLQSAVEVGPQIYFGFMAVVAAPIAEELLFRGILYPMSKKFLWRAHLPRTARWLRQELYPWLLRRGWRRQALWVRGRVCAGLRQGWPCYAVLSTSLLFGAVHLNAMTFVPLTFLALVLTWLYETTDNLLAPILTHSLFNTANFFWLILGRPVA
jgi:membrane protease YdiL (CAAX protease family)